MKNKIKIPRILRIKSIKGHTVSCIFNNGETRDIDFTVLFAAWKIKKGDPEYSLLDSAEFRKVSLRNNTLSWKNIKIKLPDLHGHEVEQPFEIDPVVLYKKSVPNTAPFKKFNLGPVIRKWRISMDLSQDQLAALSGTSKTYISRIENNLIEPELHTLHKIVEIGLGRKIEMKIV